MCVSKYFIQEEVDDERTRRRRERGGELVVKQSARQSLKNECSPHDSHFIFCLESMCGSSSNCSWTASSIHKDTKQTLDIFKRASKQEELLSFLPYCLLLRALLKFSSPHSSSTLNGNNTPLLASKPGHVCCRGDVEMWRRLHHDIHTHTERSLFLLLLLLLLLHYLLLPHIPSITTMSKPVCGAFFYNYTITIKSGLREATSTRPRHTRAPRDPHDPSHFSHHEDYSHPHIILTHPPTDTHSTPPSPSPPPPPPSHDHEALPLLHLSPPYLAPSPPCLCTRVQ